MGDEESGVAGLVVQFAEPLAQVLPDLGVECAEGLVEEQHAGFDGECPGERHALPLAARELGGITLLEA